MTQQPDALDAAEATGPESSARTLAPALVGGSGATDPQAEPVLVDGRYRLERPIGAGAMGIVWEATDELLARRVAVKELRVGPGGVLDEARERVMREARLAARLQHPHAIAVFDVVLHDDRPWLVMEYLCAVSLAQVLGERGSLPARQVAAIGSQIADALAASHAAGIVHRDIKPGNVLLTTDGQAKITDFGISHAADDVQVTSTGLIVGTPAYLAPEIVRGESSTAASDVFALGATLYAAVEGQPPFGRSENVYEVLRRVACGTVNPPSSAGPLTAVLMQLLQRSPHARPSAAQVRDQLQLIAEQTDTVAPAATTLRPAALTGDQATFSPRRARPTGFALGAALVTLVLFLLIVVSLSIVSPGSLSGSPQAAAAGSPSTAAAAVPPQPGSTSLPSLADPPGRPAAVTQPARSTAAPAALAVTAETASAAASDPQGGSDGQASKAKDKGAQARPAKAKEKDN